MKKKLLLTLIYYVFLFSGHSQVLDYSSPGWSADACNVFNDAPYPKTLNGITHYPVAGGVQFTTPDKKLDLQSRGAPMAADIYGTAFSIAKIMRPGYAYTITVNAKKTSGDTRDPTFSVCPTAAVLNPATTVCGPVPNANWQVVLDAVVNSKDIS